MNRRVRKRTQKLDLSDQPETEGVECLEVNEDGVVDWNRLPDDIVVKVFTHLNYRDRANLSSTCKIWRKLGSSPCLWKSLDLRWYRMQPQGSRCSPIQKLQFRGSDDTYLLSNLEAESLKELSIVNCPVISDLTLALVVDRHKLLESIQLGPDFCERITGDGIAIIANCCPKLKKLRLSGVSHVSTEAIAALADQCLELQEIAFVDCGNIDVVALAKVVSLRFLSIAGTTNVNWDLACESWCNLLYLKALDISRTDLAAEVAMKLISSLESLKLLCVFLCPSLEEATTLHAKADRLGITMLGFFNNKFIELSCSRNGLKKDGILAELMTWAEWILSHALLRLAEVNPTRLDELVILLLNLLQSSQEDAQEWAAIGIANVHVTRSGAVMYGGVVELLLQLATSWKEGIQSAATKAIANLSVNLEFANSVAASGGVVILASLAKSMNKWVAEEAALGLQNLAKRDEHKRVIVESGALKTLVDLIFKWPRGGDVLMERAAGALACMAKDDKCGMEVAAVGGIKAFVMLARVSKHEGVQEQVAAAFANLTAYGDSNTLNAAVGQEDGAIDALVLLIHSENEALCQEALVALSNLLVDDRNLEWIALAGGVEALVSLAQRSITAHPDLQEIVVRTIQALSASEANSIAIGREGGVAALKRLLTQSMSEDVEEAAAEALWVLTFNPRNAMRIVEDGSVMDLRNLISSESKMTRFMVALIFAYMCDGRMDEYDRAAEGGSNSYIILRAKITATNYIEPFVLSFVDRQAFSGTSLYSASARLAQAAKSARIAEARYLQCNRAEIGRFLSLLRNKFSVLKSCAAFALFQFTVPGGRHAREHVNLLQDLGAPRVLRAAAAAVAGPLEAKIFARLVLRNLEHQDTESSA